MATVTLPVLKVTNITYTTPYYWKDGSYAYRLKGKGKSGCKRVGITVDDLNITILDPLPNVIASYTVLPLGSDTLVEITQAEFDAYIVAAKTNQDNN